MCNNPNHDHDNEDLLSSISELTDPKDIAGVAIQIFCAISTVLVEAESPNPVILQAFIPMKALAERLNEQELTDIVITAEMEHHELFAKELSKAGHPAFRNRKRKGKN